MNIYPAKLAIAPLVPFPFGLGGGTPPYVYSIQSGPGTINPTTGEFIASPGRGTGIVRVTDSLGAYAEASVLVGDPLLLVCDIIQTEMGLANGRVYLWDQKINSPTDNGIFVAISQLSAKPFANNRQYDPTTGLKTLQSVNMSSVVSFDIISRDSSARERKEEILLALNSVYAEQQMELNAFRIFPLSQAFTNLSSIDGAAIPYRFSISCNLQYTVVKTKSVDYFDTFAAASVTTDP